MQVRSQGSPEMLGFLNVPQARFSSMLQAGAMAYIPMRVTSPDSDEAGMPSSFWLPLLLPQAVLGKLRL